MVKDHGIVSDSANRNRTGIIDGVQGYNRSAKVFPLEDISDVYEIMRRHPSPLAGRAGNNIGYRQNVVVNNRP
jgi:hypothetical protein